MSEVVCWSVGDARLKFTQLKRDVVFLKKIIALQKHGHTVCYAVPQEIYREAVQYAPNGQEEEVCESIYELRQSLGQWLDEVDAGNKRVVLKKGGVPIMVLLPVPHARLLKEKGVIHALHEDEGIGRSVAAPVQERVVLRASTSGAGVARAGSVSDLVQGTPPVFEIGALKNRHGRSALSGTLYWSGGKIDGLLKCEEGCRLKEIKICGRVVEHALSERVHVPGHYTVDCDVDASRFKWEDVGFVVSYNDEEIGLE